MRLLIAVLSPGTARRIAAGMEIRGFDALIAPNGTQALKLLSRERFDLLILHACLPELDGFEVLESLAALHHPCPPRVLFLCEPELCASRPALADAVAPICAAPLAPRPPPWSAACAWRWKACSPRAACGASSAFSAPRWTRNAASRPTGPFCCRPLNRSGWITPWRIRARQTAARCTTARPHPPGCRRCG